MGEFVGLVAVMCIFGIPLSAIWTSHRRQMMEMQLKMGRGNNESVQASIEALREEVRALRDTTMQYDISFDSALQRVEARVDRIERSAMPVESEKVVELSRLR